MSAPSITVGNQYHRISGVQAIYTREPGGKWQTLGGLSNAILNFPNIKSLDGQKRNKAHFVEVKASAKMKQAKLIELELMPTLMNGTNDFLFKMMDAAVVPTTTPVATEGWVMLTAAQVNVIADPDLDGTTANDRTIGLTFGGSFPKSEFAAAVKAVIADVQFECTTDVGTFHTIGVYSAALDGGLPNDTHLVTNGVASITITDVAGGSAVTLPAVKNFKAGMKCISDPGDMRLRPDVVGMDINTTYEWRQTDAASLLLLQTIIDLHLNVIITMVSGLVITYNNILGNDVDYENNGDMDKVRVARFSHAGAIPIGLFVGIISGQ